MTHSEVIWFIQQAAFICELWKCWMTLCTYMCWVTEKTCMKVFRYSRKRVVASVCANSCSAGWWEALLVERGEHCERGVICVPVMTSAGVTGWKLPRTGWRSITVDGCGLLCVLLRLYSYSFQRIWQGSVWRSCRAQGRGQTERNKWAEEICQSKLTSGGKLRNLAAGPRELANGNNGCANW